MKKIIMWLIILTILMSVSCSQREQKHGIFDSNVTLANINEQSINELKFEFSYNARNFRLLELEDGFIGCDFQQLKQDDPLNKIPIIHKIDQAGKLLWTKEFATVLKAPTVTALFTDGNENFYLALQGNGKEKSYIVKFNIKGEEIWSREFEDLSNKLLENVLITRDNEIVIIGNWRFTDGEQTNDQSIPLEAVLTKLDSNGNLLIQKELPGIQHLISKYDDSLGIIVNGASKNSQYANTIIKLDSDFNVVWSYVAAKDEFFNYKVLELFDSHIFIVGNALSEGHITNSFLVKIGKDGNVLWKKENLGAIEQTFVNSEKEKVKVEKHIEQIVIDQKGDIITNNYNGLLIIIDQMGNEKKRLNLEIGGGIKFLNDGGFILGKQRILGRVPPPFKAACDFFDTDLVIAKYDSNYKLEWRKTFDKYINCYGEDYVFVLDDGSLIVQ